MPPFALKKQQKHTTELYAVGDTNLSSDLRAEKNSNRVIYRSLVSDSVYKSDGLNGENSIHWCFEIPYAACGNISEIASFGIGYAFQVLISLADMVSDVI